MNTRSVHTGIWVALLVLWGTPSAFAQLEEPAESGPGEHTLPDRADPGDEAATPVPASPAAADDVDGKRADHPHAKPGDAKGKAADVDDAGDAGEPAEPPPGPMAMPSIPHKGTVTIVKIEDTIDLGLAPFVQRVVKRLGADDLLILDVNTLGGRVDAAIQIRDALVSAKARTVCWIHPRAISAGALICLATDVIIVAPGASIGAATPIQIGQDGKVSPVDEKMTSYMRTEMRTTAMAKGRRGEIGEAMVDRDIEIKGLSAKGKLLTMDKEQALAWGVASAEAPDETTLWQALGRPEPAKITRPTLSWAERVARFLSDPMVSGILMTLGMLGILIELYSGGSGVGLIVGLSCLALFFFGHHVVNLAGFEEILLLVVGVILLAVEIFVPGHIVPGVLGVIAIVAALVMSLVNLDSVPFEVAWEFGWVKNALARVMGSLVLTGALAVVAAKFMPKTRLGRAVVLEAVLSGTASDPVNTGLKALVGQTVKAVTDLRPAGKVIVDGRRIEAAAERGYVSAQAWVKVLKADRHRLIVRAVEPSEAGTGTESTDAPADGSPKEGGA